MKIPIDDLKAHLDQLAEDLLDALDGDDLEKALAAQQEFSGAITILFGARWKRTISIERKKPFSGWRLGGR